MSGSRARAVASDLGPLLRFISPIEPGRPAVPPCRALTFLAGVSSVATHRYGVRSVVHVPRRCDGRAR